MTRAVLMTLLILWPRHTPQPPPQRPCWYWIGLGPLPMPPAGFYWACFSPDLVWRVYPRDS